MRKSSIPRPDFMAATNHRGRLPRPDQVSDVWGFRYFGSTRGYLRLALAGGDTPDPLESAKTAIPPPRTAKRFSSSCFSALIRSDKIPLISPWSNQRSSRDIDSNSSFLADMLAPCGCTHLILPQLTLIKMANSIYPEKCMEPN